MKIKLSKSDWELIGNKTGWLKMAQVGEDLSSAEVERVKVQIGDTCKLRPLALAPFSTRYREKMNEMVKKGNGLLEIVDMSPSPKIGVGDLATVVAKGEVDPQSDINRIDIWASGLEKV